MLTLAELPVFVYVHAASVNLISCLVDPSVAELGREKSRVRNVQRQLLFICGKEQAGVTVIMGQGLLCVNDPSTHESPQIKREDRHLIYWAWRISIKFGEEARNMKCMMWTKEHGIRDNIMVYTKRR